jgi:hypothetical protein
LSSGALRVGGTRYADFSESGWDNVSRYSVGRLWEEDARGDELQCCTDRKKKSEYGVPAINVEKPGGTKIGTG